MTTITHLASGLVVAKLANTYLPNSYQPELVYGISSAFSLLPDVNMLWHKKIKTHHDDFTHYPVFWLLAGVVILLINRFFGVLLLLNAALHLLLDTYGWTIGVKWFAPFNNRELSFTKLEKDKGDYSQKEMLQYLIKNPQKLYREVFLNILFIVVLLTI